MADKLIKRVVLVSNQNRNIKELVEKLEAADFEVLRAESGQEARQVIEDNGLPHLIVIELELPDMDGLELCQELFDVAGLPIVTISAKNDAPTRAVEALTYADDYIRRPFNADETVMRIRRILSRLGNYSYATGPQIKVFDWLSVDHMNRQIYVRGLTKKLTPTENALLNVLLTHRGNIVDADTLIERVWRGDNTVKDRNALRVHVHRLRSKIEDDPDNPLIIRTERGIGYSFAEAEA